MNDEAKRIVDALRCDGYCGSKCHECGYRTNGGCYGQLLENDAADLIESLSEELECVKRERDAWRRATLR